MKPNKVTYKCQACSKDFEVEQGSRRKYCDKCGFKRIIAGRSQSRKKLAKK